MILAVVGLLREARIVAGEGVRVVVGGGDSTGLAARLMEPFPLAGKGWDGGVDSKEGYVARQPADSALHPRPYPSPQGGGVLEGVISFGVCGALAPALKPGDVVVASSVRDGKTRFLTDSAWTRSIAARLPHAISGSIAGSDAMLTTVEAKAALHGSSGAVAVDMESHIAARFAARHGLPLAVLRAVSDGADHALPAAAQRGMRPDGSMDVGAVLRALAGDPRQLPALIRTGLEAEKGFAALLRCHHLLGAALGFGQVGHHALDVT